MVEVETSNRNRALQALRTTLKRHGGTQSSTSFLFSRRGRVVFAPRRGIGVDEVLEVAIEAGAEDVVESDVESTTRADGEGEAVGETGPDARSVMLWTPPSGTSFAAKTVAERLGLEVVESDIVWAPNAETMAVVENDAAASVMKDALVALRETPDVRAVYANAARGEGVTEELWSAVEECLEA